MSKKHLVVIVMLSLVTGTAVGASYDKWSNLRWSRDIVRFEAGCYDNTTETSGEHCGTVTVFEENGNRCYVARTKTTDKNNGDPSPVAISCVKQ